MLTSSLTARAKAAFFESCVYLSVVTVTPEGGAANRFQDFVPFKSSCYFLSGGPLLEEHEKCGTPFIFAANGSRLRVYSPEKCATRHIRYFGVPGNRYALAHFRFTVSNLWHRTLCRRSQYGRVLWERMNRLIRRWLPPARICHPYPSCRLRVTT
jgi:hypothetical protein